MARSSRRTPLAISRHPSPPDATSRPSARVSLCCPKALLLQGATLTPLDPHPRLRQPPPSPVGPSSTRPRPACGPYDGVPPCRSTSLPLAPPSPSPSVGGPSPTSGAQRGPAFAALGYTLPWGPAGTSLRGVGSSPCLARVRERRARERARRPYNPRTHVGSTPPLERRRHRPAHVVEGWPGHNYHRRRP